jgi:hypothetical protein
MSEPVKYRDIPKAERKRLIQEVTSTWEMRGLLFACIVVPVLCSNSVRDYLISHRVLPFGEFFTGLIVAFTLPSAAVLAIYSPVMRHEVVSRKNA